ncbi:MAG TPA: penicillin-binding protein 2 [Candidatus Acidoferrum sp.]|nr:penicillin-binding protein 2 [Candidatus Acidoferrum sp.]
MRLRRLIGIFLAIICIFALLVLRLWSLSVSQGETLAEAAIRQQHVSVSLAQRTGLVYDCNGEPLNYEAGYGAALVEPQLCYDKAQALRVLSVYAGMSREEAEERLNGTASFGVELRRADISVPGFTIVERVAEVNKPLAVHVVDEIESSYADYLAVMGGEVYASLQRTASGYALPGGESRLVEGEYYEPGGVLLTIDAGMQQIVEEAWTGGSGAIVLMEAETGKVRAAASFPGYDKAEIASLLSSEKAELYNRAFGAYNVGSVFKIIVAGETIERGVKTPTLFCSGSTTVDGRVFGCHYSAGHGWVNFEAAFLASCNPYFIGLLDEEGFQAAVAMARKLGFTTGTKLAAGLTEEAGRLPASNGILVRANTAIGQGDIMGTPVDLANLLSTVARGGIYREPRLVEGLIGRDGELLRNLTTQEPAARVWSEETSDRLLELLIGVCERGTGRAAKPAGFSVAGKTASAETGWRTADGGDVVHGIFAGLFPADNPKYALVVIVENGRSGSAAAAPIFREIAEKIIEIDG